MAPERHRKALGETRSASSESPLSTKRHRDPITSLYPWATNRGFGDRTGQAGRSPHVAGAPAASRLFQSAGTFDSISISRSKIERPARRSDGGHNRRPEAPSSLVGASDASTPARESACGRGVEQEGSGLIPE